MRRTWRQFSPAEHNVFWRLMRKAALKKHESDILFDARFPESVEILGVMFSVLHTTGHGLMCYQIRPGIIDAKVYPWMAQFGQHDYMDLNEDEVLPGFLYGDEADYLRDMTLLRTALC